jgi:hypothetical protein
VLFIDGARSSTKPGHTRVDGTGVIRGTVWIGLRRPKYLLTKGFVLPIRNGATGRVRRGNGAQIKKNRAVVRHWLEDECLFYWVIDWPLG